MNADARCALTELRITECGHCKGLRSAEEEARGERTHRTRFRAHHPGYCASCDTEFAAGELIRSDGHGGFVGDGCCG